MDRFDPQVHLSNNSVQKNFKNGERSGNLPDNNMWSSDDFKAFLNQQGKYTKIYLANYNMDKIHVVSYKNDTCFYPLLQHSPRGSLIDSRLCGRSNVMSSAMRFPFCHHTGRGDAWEETIYPGMKQAIIAVLISCQESLEYRKNSFELYGADFMIDEGMQPWLIEINSSPALGPSTHVTERLCRNVLEDTLKVKINRRIN